MKLITLNTWGGKLYPELRKFISDNKDQTDIFCFQEVFSTNDENKELDDYRVNLYSELVNHLPGFEAEIAVRGEGYLYFKPVDFNLSYGLAAFVRTGKEVDSFTDEAVCRMTAYDGRKKVINVQIVRLKDVTILNLHGAWIKGSHKKDTPERIEQSQSLKRIMEEEIEDGKGVILCGDLNLRPDTESIEIIESAGVRNLVDEYNVTDTRTKFYDKDVRFADYIFVSDDVQVNDFKVMPDVVSDHAPLYLDFEILS